MARFNVNLDYYGALGIQLGAGDDAVEAAWKRAAFENHPDRAAARRTLADQAGVAPPDEAAVARQFAVAREAWSVLSNGNTRREYDEARAWEAGRAERERRARVEAERGEARRRQAQADQRRASWDSLDAAADWMAQERERARKQRLREEVDARLRGRGPGHTGAYAGPSPRYAPASERDIYDFSVMTEHEKWLWRKALAALRG